MSKQKCGFNAYLICFSLVSLLSFNFVIISDAREIISGDTKPKIVDVTFVPKPEQEWGWNDGIPKTFEVGYIKVTVQNIGNGNWYPIDFEIISSKIGSKETGYGSKEIGYKLWYNNRVQADGNVLPTLKLNPSEVGTIFYDVRLDVWENSSGQTIVDKPTIIARSYYEVNKPPYEDSVVLDSVNFKVPVQQQPPKAPGFQLIYAILGITLIAILLRKLGRGSR